VTTANKAVMERAHEVIGAVKPSNSNHEGIARKVEMPEPHRIMMSVAHGVCYGLLHAFQVGLGAPSTTAPFDVMTADEVAEFLRLDRKTVYDYAGRGEIPARRLGKRLLFSRDAIALWLRSCCKGSSESDSK
jgi:excisionase family DNA binding protein